MALNAFGGGYYGMAGAEGVPLEWLHDTPFKNYFFPGLVLFVVVGGAALFAAICIFRKRHGRRATFISAAVVLVWLLVQV
ncbi:MAG TPA: hypothetical protein VL093_08325 [Flavipsychrobacter sp.]|nr:hypothetical protein [Flavipsychrobacter sp.]